MPEGKRNRLTVQFDSFFSPFFRRMAKPNDRICDTGVHRSAAVDALIRKYGSAFIATRHSTFRDRTFKGSDRAWINRKEPKKTFLLHAATIAEIGEFCKMCANDHHNTLREWKTAKMRCRNMRAHMHGFGYTVYGMQGIIRFVECKYCVQIVIALQNV